MPPNKLLLSNDKGWIRKARNTSLVRILTRSGCITRKDIYIFFGAHEKYSLFV